MQKVLARSGVASRRRAEDLIREGRVRVNGRTVLALGERVDPARFTVTVDGHHLRPESEKVFLLNKPRGFVCSSVPQGRNQRSVLEIFAREHERLFAAGRLDEDSEGLLVVTNDGALSEALTHPRYGVPKTYRVTVTGAISPQALARMARGVHLAERKTLPAKIRVLRRGRTGGVLEITVAEGANREVRRICARVGLGVRRLIRASIGKLSLAGIPSGAYRTLNQRERRYCHTLRSRVLDKEVKAVDDPTGER
ncbi:MAG: pseudouridine synthase [Planctomycetota bacterium]